MTCIHCGKEIATMSDYHTRTKCRECYNRYQREYMAVYSKTEKYRKWHREYWRGGPVRESARSEW